MLGERDLVQRLADVAQVGEASFAADLAEHPRGQPGGGGDLDDRGDPAGGDELGPVPQGLGHLVGQPVTPLVDLAGRAAQEAGQRRRPHPGAAVRLLEALEQGEPLDGGGGGEDAAAARDHGGHPHLEQRLLRGLEVGVAVADDGDVARLELAALERGTRGEQPAYVEGEVARDVRTHRTDGQRGGVALAERLAPHDAQPQRHRGRGTDEAGLPVVGGHLVDDDPVVAELGADHQLLERGEQALVAAPVDGQGLLVVGGGCRRRGRW